MYSLVINVDTPQEKKFNLKEGITTIGRSEENDIVLSNKSLSRKHALIEVKSDEIIIRDLQSKNGTFVNGIKIKEEKLRENDIIKCGDILFTLKKGTSFNSGISIIKELHSDINTFYFEDLLKKEKSGVSALKVKEEEALKRNQDKLKILLEVSKILNSPDEINSLLNKILDLLFQIMDVDRAAIIMLDEKSGRLIPKVVKSTIGSYDSSTQIYSNHIANYVIEKNVSVITSDATEDPRFDNAKSVIYHSIRSSMCVPLKTKNQIIGLLYVDNLYIPNRFTEEDLEFLTAFASQAAFAIENSKLYKKLEQEAILINNFLRFFPPNTVKQIISSKDINLGVVEREVTALFCDISDFTYISSYMEPRKVVDILNEYFPVMCEIIFKYEGTLEKYIGDALMAVWGAPFARNDDADRALYAAIEMQRALQKLNKKWESEGKNFNLKIHIGLNTGKVAAGNIGSEHYIQYATIGDAINIASRLCSTAKGGDILISEETYNHLNSKGKIPLEKLPLINLKGKEGLFEVYKVLWDKDFSLN